MFSRIQFLHNRTELPDVKADIIFVALVRGFRFQADTIFENLDRGVRCLCEHNLCIIIQGGHIFRRSKSLNPETEVPDA
jgi:hypothetical protein